MRPLLALLLLPLALIACAAPQGDGASTASPESLDLESAAQQAASAMTAEGLEGAIRALSDDSMAGRGPGSEGDRATQHYLIQRMQEIGLEPGGADGSWLQSFPIVGITAESPETWTFQADGGELSLKFSEEFVTFSGVQEDEAALEDAELVFVGYGIEAPEYEWDDYKGTDLSGKVLVMLNNDPEWDPELFAGERRLYYGRWTYKYEMAAAKGAAGAIVIHTTPSAGYPWQVVQTSWTGPQFELPATGEPRYQVGGWTTWEASQKLMELAGHDLDALVESARGREFQPVPLGITTSIRLTNTVDQVETANVLGLLPGRGGDLADEAVVFTAHHDHLGVGSPNDEGDTIYNGALDNGAGCAQLLEIARAFKALPEAPRRSILFAFVAAEEQGLLGSAFYAANPTFPPGKIAANINYDGGNIWGRTKDVGFIGYGKSSLDALVERFAADQGRTVKPDQFPDRGFYYRSDQFNFAKIGVPAIYLDNGTEFIDRPEGWGVERLENFEAEHYHQPSDEISDDWVYDGMIEDARLGFYCGVHLAESEEMPTWNPGDEFEAARKAALAAVAGP